MSQTSNTINKAFILIQVYYRLNENHRGVWGNRLRSWGWVLAALWYRDWSRSFTEVRLRES